MYINVWPVLKILTVRKVPGITEILISLRSTSYLIELTWWKVSVSSSEKGAKEVIYSVVDILTQSYNSTYQSGFTKSKLHLAVKLAKNMNMSAEDIDKLKKV